MFVRTYVLGRWLEGPGGARTTTCLDEVLDYLTYVAARKIFCIRLANITFLAILCEIMIIYRHFEYYNIRREALILLRE